MYELTYYVAYLYQLTPLYQSVRFTVAFKYILSSGKKSTQTKDMFV